jgi:cold shock protein
MATGTVKSFNPAKGYGFIKKDSIGADLFVHLSAVREAGLADLRKGQKISFGIFDNQGKAADVDADEGDSKSFCHGGLLVFGASHEHCLLLGREHGRTIPLSDIGPVRQFQWLASYVDGGGLPALRAAKPAPIALSSGSRKNLIAV